MKHIIYDFLHTVKSLKGLGMKVYLSFTQRVLFKMVSDSFKIPFPNIYFHIFIYIILQIDEIKNLIIDSFKVFCLLFSLNICLKNN